MKIAKEIFKQRIISGELMPDKVEKSFDSKGPLIMLDYTTHRLRLHIHFNDDGEYEDTGRAHIKTYEGKHIELIDGREVALIRMHIEKFERSEIILDKIDESLKLSGLNRIDIKDKNFSVSYLRKRKFAEDTVFLIVKHYNDEFTANEYVKKAKDWCKDKLNASTPLNIKLLNIIIIHDHQLTNNDITGLLDKKGYHAAIIKSITLIDRTSNTIIQESHGTGSFANLSSNLKETIKQIRLLKIDN